jgi:hypothetical protein
MRGCRHMALSGRQQSGELAGVKTICSWSCTWVGVEHNVARLLLPVCELKRS